MYGADMSGYEDMFQYARSIFTTDHCLFLTGSPNLLGEDAFRNMESDYGIVPMPKYDESQAEYVSTVTNMASVFAIPSTVRNDIGSNERTGMILEYMAYKSNELVLPKYYDTLLKGQRLNSEDDQVMLDIVRENIHYVFAAMMGDSLTDIKTNYEAMCSSPSSAASTFRAKSKVMQAALDDFYMDMLAVEDKLAGK
jgi:hypothetical protein